MAYPAPYHMDVTVRMHDVDCLRRVSPAAMMRLFHTAADCQMRDEGMSMEQVRQSGKALILSRLALRFYAPAYQNETLRLETWPVPSRGFQLQRCYRALRGDTLLAQGESTWALVDRKTRRLLKSDQVDFSAFTHGESLFLETGIAPFGGTYAPAGHHLVGYSDIDVNLHMNNTRYIDMLCDLAPDLARRTALALQVHYRNEAPLASTIELQRGDCGDAFYFRTFCQGKPNIDAAIVLSQDT